MWDVPIAIGYLRSDVSGARQRWDENQIRSLAGRFGYSLSKTVVLSGHIDDCLDQLIDTVGKAGAEAVVSPGLAHFGGVVPGALVGITDLITVSPLETYARWIIPPDAPADMGIR